MENMNRVVTSTVTREISTAELNGWKLSFTVESTSGFLKTISATASNGNQYLSANRQEAGSIAASFNTGYDAAIVQTVVNEFEVIVASFVVIEEVIGE